MNWVNVKGVATLKGTGYEVRVAERLDDGRPIRWSVFKNGVKMQEAVGPWKSFATAKSVAEYNARQDEGTRPA